MEISGDRKLLPLFNDKRKFSYLSYRNQNNTTNITFNDRIMHNAAKHKHIPSHAFKEIRFRIRNEMKTLIENQENKKAIQLFFANIIK